MFVTIQTVQTEPGFDVVMRFITHKFFHNNCPGKPLPGHSSFLGTFSGNPTKICYNQFVKSPLREGFHIYKNIFLINIKVTYYENSK